MRVHFAGGRLEMTLKEIEELDSNTLTVKQVAEFLGKDPQVIRDQAEREPKYLGFPICKAGHSYTIPRLGFINWFKGMTPMLVWKEGLPIETL